MILIFLGTAGSGKTTITASFGEYLEKNGKSVGYVNLDTGVKKLPYRPDIDVRDIITVEELMKEGYGPNGAIVESYDRLLSHAEGIVGGILELDEERDYLLIDTPGQMESFLFHDFGIRITEHLSEPLVAYLFSPEILKKPRDYCFVRFFAIMIALRLGTTTVPVLNKVDLIKEELPSIRRLLEEVDYLNARLRLDPSMQGLLASRICSFLPEVSSPVRVVYASAKTGEGFDELETLSYEHYCTCGDLT
ncbi:ATP/GTP-binding protein [Thermococcus waiotapuensis]|uniref:ATP/GTP-binding protein n=1 Tax=Thermococcus waiotapuensis TaxID=90909 RepID=A0AAE4NUZ9_9EURY|nr:ATP/GTP-binding protein [Thermococcus waiotapuensis]MDV3103111.1 ATP/GTP-binding protein [Thermococcus waiotapuensis]